MGEKKEIIIDLSRSSNAKEYEKDAIVHQREIIKAKELIKKRLERSNSENIRYNDTISIIGSRGSGKTSFLYSLLKSYNSDPDIQVLPIIDPTLIEEKGHIFLVVISLIQCLISEKLDENDCNPHDTNYSLNKEWKDKLRKLAAGLPTIDGVGGVGVNETSWQDPEYILDKGLKSVKSAIDLEKNFDELLKFALKVLNKKLFIISLDDIDVDFKKGWPVLETIRKYFTSPRLAILLSGDFELFTKAIRKQQWNNFGKALLINEIDKQGKIEKYNNLVTEMESQYLQKVLKPENRIHLSTLFEKINLFKDDVCILFSENHDKSKKFISKYYSDILSLFGINNPYQAEAYKSFLLNLPLRSQIQFLQQYESLSIGESTNVSDAFLSDLYEKEVDVKLATNLPKMLNVIILKLLLKEKNLAEAYQLQPTTDNVTLNSSLTALSFIFSKHSKDNPFIIFDYLIKIGYIRNLSSFIKYSDNSKDAYTIEDLCKSSGAFQDKVLRDVVSNITAYLNGILNFNDNNIKEFVGILELPGLASKAKGKNKEYRIDEVFKNATDEEKKIANLPIAISINSWNNVSIVTASFYILLASISELIRKGLLRKISFENISEEEKENNLREREQDIALGLLELSQIRSYLMPDFGKHETKKTIFIDNDNDEEIELDSSNDEDIQNKIESVVNIAKYVNEWIDRYESNGKITVSPHLLGKISTRFYSALDGISHTRKYDNLGDYFYRMIIALANTIIIEELKEVGSSILKAKEFKNEKTYNDLNLNNTVTSNSIFIKNLSIADNYKTHLPLSKWLLSCPLFLLYLPNEIDKETIKTKQAYLKFIESSYEENDIKPSEIWDKSIYSKLYNVVISGASKDIFEKKRKKVDTTESNIVSKEVALTKFENSSEVIRILITNKIPFKLFIDSYNKKIMKAGSLYKKCSKVFETDNLNKHKIKSFVDFVRKYTGEDQSINAWIQAQ